MNKSIPLIAFIVVCVLDLLGIYLKSDLIIYIAKPLLMVTLFWYYFMNTSSLNKLFVAGLAFSFLGDVFLMGDGKAMFISGLLFFLMAHVFYIIMLVKWIRKPTLSKVILTSIPYVLIFIAIMYLLYDGLDDMRIPVIVYAMTISLFGIVSLIHFTQNQTRSSSVLVVGVLLFILSDAILAMNLFLEPRPFYPFMNMTTYVLAQFLICRFVILKMSR